MLLQKLFTGTTFTHNSNVDTKMTPKNKNNKKTIYPNLFLNLNNLNAFLFLNQLIFNSLIFEIKKAEQSRPYHNSRCGFVEKILFHRPIESYYFSSV